jgi:hypothetical protein
MIQKEERGGGGFEKVCRILLGNEKVENYSEIVQEPILSDSAVGHNMSLELHSHFGFCFLKTWELFLMNMAKISVRTFLK